MKLFKALFFLAIAFLLFGCSSGDDDARVGLAAPRFGSISDNWDSAVNSLGMHEYWLAFEGVDREGTNYFLLPKAAGPFTCSERFNPDSPYFQSWFGMYTVEDNAEGPYAIEGGEVVTDDIIKLALADQKAWLTAYGVPAADLEVSVDADWEYAVEDVVVDGTAGWKLRGKMRSNVDVGDANEISFSPLASVDPDIWAGKIGSYAEVVLDGVFYVWYSSENKELNVAYYNGVAFTDELGVPHATFDDIEAELESMIAGLTVYE